MMCVAKVAKKVRKAAVDEAIATLEKASQSAPEMSDVAKGIVESTGGGKSGSKPEDVAPKKEVWDLNYRSFGRFPRSLMQKMLLVTLQSLRPQPCRWVPLKVLTPT